MTAISDQQLLHWNHLGLIPGPLETSEEFTARATYCLSLQEHLSEELKAQLGTVTNGSSAILSNGLSSVADTYDISPTWIPVFFSNYQLTPWHGGCAWIFQMSDSTPTAALLQLRQSLRQSPSYLGLYQRDELIAHELAHVGRMKFEEPRYEEIFAYRTSPSAFRRWLGPLVQSSYESMLFVLVLALIVFIDIFLLAFYNFNAYLSAAWLKAIPVSMIVLALIRLWSRQRRLHTCVNNIASCLTQPQKTYHVLYRLTDDEIDAFSNMTPQEIKAYAKAEVSNSLRWRLIHQAYF